MKKSDGSNKANKNDKMKKIMKKIGLIFIFCSLVLLSGCSSKQADLSGTYYYVQYSGFYSDVSGDSNIVHQIIIKKTDQTNQNYVVYELGMDQTNVSEGTLSVDGDLLNLSLSRPSTTLGSDVIGCVDISNIKGAKFTFKKDIIAIGSETYGVDLYKDSTDMGEKYQEIHTGRELWSTVFETEN